MHVIDEVLGGPALTQARELRTAIPGPRSTAMLERKREAVADGVGLTLPVGLKSTADYPNLVAELMKRGYRDEDLRKLLGGNLMRVWHAVERRATD